MQLPHTPYRQNGFKAVKLSVHYGKKSMEISRCFTILVGMLCRTYENVFLCWLQKRKLENFIVFRI